MTKIKTSALLLSCTISLASGLLLAQVQRPGEYPRGEKPSPMMNFFVTSEPIGDGGNLGGLAGADAHCQVLATAVLGVGRAIPRLGLRDEKTVIQALEEGFAVLEQGPAAAAVERLRGPTRPSTNSNGKTRRSSRRRLSPASPEPEPSRTAGAFAPGQHRP